MLAEVDFEILLHVSHFTNIDLSSRGVYCIRVGLQAGDTSKDLKIEPIGCFSAPLTIDAIVGGRNIVEPSKRGVSSKASTIQVWCGSQPLENAHIDDDDMCFYGRSFIVRFRDELHVSRCFESPLNSNG